MPNVVCRSFECSLNLFHIKTGALPAEKTTPSCFRRSQLGCRISMENKPIIRLVLTSRFVRSSASLTTSKCVIIPVRPHGSLVPGCVISQRTLDCWDLAQREIKAVIFITMSRNRAPDGQRIFNHRKSRGRAKTRRIMPGWKCLPS